MDQGAEGETIDSGPATGAPRRGWRHYRLVLVSWIWVVLATLLFLFAPGLLTPVALLENSLGDLRAARLLAPADPHRDVVMVTITEDTFAEKKFPYRSPLDRKFLAQLLFLLHEAGVRAVGVDLLIDQPTEPEKDQLLKQVIDAYSVPLFFSYGTEANHLTPGQVTYLNKVLPVNRRGMANLVSDVRDGVVRYIFAGQQVGDDLIPGLANALAHAAGRPLLRGNPAALIYRRPADPAVGVFVSLEAQYVELFGQAKRLGPMVKDKIVLIGSDLPTEDQHLTPFGVRLGVQSRTIPGVMIHAHALAQLLDGYGLRMAPDWSKLVIAVLLTALPLWLVLWSSAAWAVRIATLAVLIVGYEAVAFFGPGAGWLALPMVAPFLGFALAVAAGVTLMAYSHRAERRFIEDAFSRFVSPQVIGLLQKDPSRLRRGGERRTVSLIFTDVANFTSLSEETEPEALVAMLNDYLEGMAEQVMNRNGTLDKYIGDGMVALFGAPLDQADHASRALDCARDLDRFAQDFMKRQRDVGVAFGRTRIGVHTGQAIVGNIGSHRHLNYTSVGDTVNTASRLEGAGRYLGTRMLVSADTMALVDPEARVQMRRVGDLVVKGRHGVLAVFEPWEESWDMEWRNAYNEAFDRLEDNDNDGAMQAFAALLAEWPEDYLAAFHVNRLRAGEKGVRVVLKEK